MPTITDENKYKNRAMNFFKDRLSINLFTDEDQMKYVSSILDPVEETNIVFSDSKAGTGKTSLAVYSALYLILEKGEYDRLYYIRNNTSVIDVGYLPGTLTEKMEPFMTPFIEAVDNYGLKSERSQDLYRKISGNLEEDDMDKSEKIIYTQSTFSVRGTDRSEKSIIIIDEAQNLTLNELRAVLTRPHDNCKIIVIGSSAQVDNDKKLDHFGKERLIPFQLYQKHFKENDIGIAVHIANLTKNYRGKLSQHADDIDSLIKKIELEENKITPIKDDLNKLEVIV